MAVNQIMQDHDRFFNGSGGTVTYGGSAPGTTVIRTDGTWNVRDGDVVTGPSDGQGPFKARFTEDLNRPLRVSSLPTTTESTVMIFCMMTSMNCRASNITKEDLASRSSVIGVHQRV
jgi:hypothetical protein